MKRYPFLVMLVFVVGLCLIGPISSASAWTGIVRGVVNADGGVFWRGDPPDWNNPIRNIGYGVYNGDQIEIDCWTTGSTVPPYNNNTLWYHARIAAGQGKGDGFVNDHFIDTGINQPNIVIPGVPSCSGSPAPAPPPPSTPTPPPGSPAPSPSGGSVYSIFNADGGVFFRDSPSWGDTRQVVGQGVYNGDQVRLICGAMGEAVGPYANRWWSYVENVTRSGAGKGWVNAHFINDAMPANSPSPGEGTCDGNPSAGGGSGSGGQTPVSSGPKSVYFWPPLPHADQWPAGVARVADIDYTSDQWTRDDGSCSPELVRGLSIPDSVNTLAGWSKSRLAPMYFLALFSEAASHIHTIILFDPGNYAQMSGSGCDHKFSPSINGLLASWLGHPENELLILSGVETEDKEFSWQDFHYHPKYRGLWNFYFHDLWPMPQQVRSRAIVCDYDALPHVAVLQNFYPLVRATGYGFRPSGCPVSPFAPTPVRWSP